MFFHSLYTLTTLYCHGKTVPLKIKGANHCRWVIMTTIERFQMEKISSFSLLFPSFTVPLKYDSRTLLAVVTWSLGASSKFVSCSPHSLHSAHLVSSYSSFSRNSSSRTKDMLTAVLGASPHYCYCLDMHTSSSTST